MDETHQFYSYQKKTTKRKQSLNLEFSLPQQDPSLPTDISIVHGYQYGSISTATTPNDDHEEKFDDESVFYQSFPTAIDSATTLSRRPSAAISSSNRKFIFRLLVLLLACGATIFLGHVVETQQLKESSTATFLAADTKTTSILMTSQRNQDYRDDYNHHLPLMGHGRKKKKKKNVRGSKSKRSRSKGSRSERRKEDRSNKKSSTKRSKGSRNKKEPGGFEPTPYPGCDKVHFQYNKELLSWDQHETTARAEGRCHLASIHSLQANTEVSKMIFLEMDADPALEEDIIKRTQKVSSSGNKVLTTDFWLGGYLSMVGMDDHDTGSKKATMGALEWAWIDESIWDYGPNVTNLTALGLGPTKKKKGGGGGGGGSSISLPVCISSSINSTSVKTTNGIGYVGHWNATKDCSTPLPAIYKCCVVEDEVVSQSGDSYSSADDDDSDTAMSSSSKDYSESASSSLSSPSSSGDSAATSDEDGTVSSSQEEEDDDDDNDYGTESNDESSASGDSASSSDKDDTPVTPSEEERDDNDDNEDKVETTSPTITSTTQAAIPLSTSTPTEVPATTEAPTELATTSPTPLTTSAPTINPTLGAVTLAPTVKPTPAPVTSTPTIMPTQPPVTGAPTMKPTTSPVTESPTIKPTPSPTTESPTVKPTPSPTTESPTIKPTPIPTTESPTIKPTPSPVTQPPTSKPTPAPVTESPTSKPTPAPVTESPTIKPRPIDSVTINPTVPV